MPRTRATSKINEKPIACMARAAAKLVIQLEDAGQLEAARQIREIATAAAEAMRRGAPAPVSTVVPTPAPTAHVLAQA